MNRLSFLLFLLLLPACSEIAPSRSSPERYLESANEAREQAVYATEREQEALRRGTLYRERHGQQTLEEEQAAYEDARLEWVEERGSPPDCIYLFNTANEAPCRWEFINENDWEKAAERWADSFISWMRAAEAWDKAALAFSMYLATADKADSTDQEIERRRQAQLSREYSDIMTAQVEEAKEHTEEANRLFDLAIYFEAEAELADTLP